MMSIQNVFKTRTFLVLLDCRVEIKIIKRSTHSPHIFIDVTIKDVCQFNNVEMMTIRMRYAV